MAVVVDGPCLKVAPIGAHVQAHHVDVFVGVPVDSDELVIGNLPYRCEATKFEV